MEPSISNLRQYLHRPCAIKRWALSPGEALPDLETLLVRCREGDDLAWEALVRMYQARVFGVAFQFMRDREEARDAAQEIFIRMYRGLGSLEEGRSFLPWMLRLARNCCIDRLRRAKVRTPEIAIPIESAPEIPSTELSPEQATMMDARQELLHRALGHLSESDRELILLKDIQELKVEEISKLLSLPTGTIKSRTFRIRVELAKVVRRLDPAYGA